jgi:hypothetical protein
VNNVPNETEKYVVARWSDEMRSLWYWGSWDNLEDAEEAAKNTGGIVVRRIGNESV